MTAHAPAQTDPQLAATLDASRRCATCRQLRPGHAFKWHRSKTWKDGRLSFSKECAECRKAKRPGNINAVHGNGPRP